MNLKDCYIKLGGDFSEVLGRLRREILRTPRGNNVNGKQ